MLIRANYVGLRRELKLCCLCDLGGMDDTLTPIWLYSLGMRFPRTLSPLIKRVPPRGSQTLANLMPLLGVLSLSLFPFFCWEGGGRMGLGQKATSKGPYHIRTSWEGKAWERGAG